MFYWARKYRKNEIKFENNVIGKILIDKPYSFALINLFDPDFNKFKDKDLLINNNKVKIIN